MTNELITVTAYDEFREKVDEVKEACNHIPDASTDEGYQKAKRISLDVGKILTSVEKKRKELKSESLERGRLIDAEAKSIVAALEGFQLPHKEAYKQLDNLRKEREAARKEELELQVQQLRGLPEAMQDADSSMVKIALEDLIANECLKFFEYTEQALKARDASRKALSTMFAEKLKQEKDAAELAELRRKQAEQDQRDRDEAIRKEAAEKAEAQAREAKEAEQRAIDQAAEAVKQREEAEERERVEKEKRRVDYHERMIRHIIDCGNGFIGGEPHSYGLLFHELEEKIIIDESFEEFREQAEGAKAAALLKLTKMQEHSARQARESEELEERRKQEKERVAESERQAKRESNKKHIGKIRKEAKESLMAIELSEEDAKKVVMAIHNGEIKNVSIKY